MAKTKRKAARMKTVHDVLRDKLYREAGFVREEVLSIPDLKVSEWSSEFEKLMRNRLLIGAFRYGLIHAPNKPKFDRVEYMHTKLKRYEETGNLEALVDTANLALLEFEEGKHPKRHFASLDNTNEHCGVKA